MTSDVKRQFLQRSFTYIMNEKNDLTTGSVLKNLLLFALPYLLACFMQTFYGMADLFVVGLYNDSATTTAVSIGSQVMHMLTVIIVGFAMGATVRIARCVGGQRRAFCGPDGGGGSRIFYPVYSGFDGCSFTPDQNNNKYYVNARGGCRRDKTLSGHLFCGGAFYYGL